MRGLIDGHLHTRLCGHGSGTVAEYAAAAVEKRLAGIVMTEHLPLPHDLDRDRTLSMSPDAVDAYFSEIEAARLSFPDLEVITGIEADWLPERVSETAGLLNALKAHPHGVKVVLGSVHFLGEWAFDDPTRVEEWDGRDVDRVWEDYATEWCRAATSGLFDVMAHPDLPKKFGHRPSGDADELYGRLAAAAAAGGVMVEVSTAGLRKPVRELYPSPGLLRAFAEAGVPATLGSDAHTPSEVGFGFDQACEALRAAGYAAVRFLVAPGDIRSVAL